MPSPFSEDKNKIVSVLKFAFPIMIQNIAFLMMQFVDSAMVGNLGAVAIASVSISTSPMWLIEAIIQIIGIGCTVIVARLIGAKENNKAGIVAGFAFYLSIIIGFILMMISILWGKYLPIIMGAEKEVIPYASQYYITISLSFIPRFLCLTLFSIFRGAGDSKTPMYISIISNLLNIAGDFFLIYPIRNISILNLNVSIWGAGWGVYGAAVSTSLSISISFAVFIILIKKKKSLIPLDLKSVFNNFNYLKQIIKIGLPASIERILRVSGQVVFFRVVATFGTIAIAANQLAITIESLSFTLGEAFGIAAMTYVGQFLGKKDYKSAGEYANSSFFICVMVMSFLGLVFFIFPEFLLSVFTKDIEVIRTGATLLRIVAFTQPFFASYIVYSGSLRGAGDTKSPMVISLISKVFIRIIFTFIFYFIGFGVTGAWCAMLIDQIIHGTLIYIRYKNDKWKNIRVIENI